MPVLLTQKADRPTGQPPFPVSVFPCVSHPPPQSTPTTRQRQNLFFSFKFAHYPPFFFPRLRRIMRCGQLILPPFFFFPVNYSLIQLHLERSQLRSPVRPPPPQSSLSVFSPLLPSVPFSFFRGVTSPTNFFSPPDPPLPPPPSLPERCGGCS